MSNIINSENCFNENLYPKDWDQWLIKQPSCNKEWIKEFNKKNNITPWSDYDKNNYISIECRKARNTITNEEYEKMNNHINEMKRLDIKTYFNEYYKKLIELHNCYSESTGEYKIKAYFKILERISHFFSLLGICIEKLCEEHNSPELTIDNIKYIDDFDKTELQEKFLLKEIDDYYNKIEYKKGYFRRRVIYKFTEYRNLSFLLSRCKHILKHINDLYSNIKPCKKHLCYCIFEINYYERLSTPRHDGSMINEKDFYIDSDDESFCY